MQRILTALTAALAVLAFTASAQDPNDPFAAEVIAYEPAGDVAPYDDPAKALGPPRGFGPMVPNNDTIVSLGAAGGSITLRMANPVVQDSANPMGLDFIVWSNAFWVGGDPQRRYQEPAIVEIAQDPDGPWYFIPGSRGFEPEPFPRVEEPPGFTNETVPELLAGSIYNPNAMDGDPDTNDIQYNWGYAKLSPTMQPYLDNYVRPSDPLRVQHTPRAGGGDAFAIEWAVDANGEPAGITEFQYIRLTTLVDRQMGMLGTSSSEIMAVGAVAPDVDTSGNGILDAWERYVGADPERPENTVLPLEIPAIEGGSSPGTVLGEAEDADGNRIRLYAGERRSEEDRNYNVIVDIRAADDPGGALPETDYVKSDAVRVFEASEADFVEAGVEPAQFTIAYRAADISGLEEDGLRPFRHSNGQYVADDITDVEVNPGPRTVSFRSPDPGTYILAAPEGEGATETPGPEGEIVLSADPPEAMPADPEATVTVTSDEIRDGDGEPISDGALFTVLTTRGEIVSSDADPAREDVQIASEDGRIEFIVQPGAVAGGIFLSASSVEGSAYGALEYVIEPGPPAPPAALHVGSPEGEDPVTIPVTVGPVTDSYGNSVRDGTLLTVAVDRAVIVSGDADDSQPGHQVVLTGGQATFYVEAAAEEETFTVRAFGDSEQAESLGERSFSSTGFTPAPLSLPVIVLFVGGALLAVGARRVSRGPSHA